MKNTFISGDPNALVKTSQKKRDDISYDFCNDEDTHDILLDDAARFIYNFQVLFSPLAYSSAGGVLDFSTPNPNRKKNNRLLDDYPAVLLHMCCNYDNTKERFFVAVDWTECKDDGTGRLAADDNIHSEELLISETDIPFFDKSILQSPDSVKTAMSKYSNDNNKSQFLSKAEVAGFRTTFQNIQMGNYPSNGAFFKKASSFDKIGSTIVRYYWGYDPEELYKLRLILVGVDSGMNIFVDGKVKESSRPKKNPKFVSGLVKHE